MIKNITIVGGGILGSQIAFQLAFKKCNVTIYNHNTDSIKRTQQKLTIIQNEYLSDLNHAQKDYNDVFNNLNIKTNLLPNVSKIINDVSKNTNENLNNVINQINFETNIKNATANADLIIECVPEVLSIKEEVWTSISKVAPQKTIFTTNTSTILPSQLVKFVDRPTKFLAFHFANQIWKRNLVEIMGQVQTDHHIYEEVVGFARYIGMVPIQLKEEIPAYILNNMVIPLLNAAQMLYINKIADPYTIDKDWMIGTNSSIGPFGMLDIIGIKTAYNIVKESAEKGDTLAIKVANNLKENFIDKNKLGVISGEGFYKYPHPAYKDPSFLK